MYASDLAGYEFRLVATDITGAQTQIDYQHTTTWSFTLPANVTWVLKGGTLMMKDGAQTTAQRSPYGKGPLEQPSSAIR
jgi:hypothetical protein